MDISRYLTEGILFHIFLVAHDTQGVWLPGKISQVLVVKGAAHLALAISVSGFHFENVPVTPSSLPIVGGLHHFRMLFI